MARPRPRVWSLATALVLSASAPALSHAQSPEEAADPRAALVARMGGDDLPIDGELRLFPELPALVRDELPAGPAAARARLEQAIRAGSADALHTLAQDLSRIPGARALSRRASYEEARLRTARSPEWRAAMERAARLRVQAEQDERSVAVAARLALMEVDIARTWPRPAVIGPPSGLEALVAALTRRIQQLSDATTEAFEAYARIARLRVPGARLVVIARQAELYRALVLSMVRVDLVGVPAAFEARIAATLVQQARPIECFVLLRYWEVVDLASPYPHVAAFAERATSILRSAGRERLLECARDGSRHDIGSDAATLLRLFPSQPRALRGAEPEAARRR